MARNPYEPEFEYGPDGRPILKLPPRVPVGEPLPGVVPSLGNPTPAQPASLNALTPTPTPTPSAVGSTVPTFTNRSVPDFATARGGYVGAATDAEALKSLQDRALQDQAAAFNVAQLNKGADAERDTRATRLGIDRRTLDALEGRGQPNTLNALAPQAPTFDPLSRPGDSFQDTRGRKAEFDTMLKEAASARGGSRKALIDGALGLLAPGVARDAAATKVYDTQVTAQAAQAKSLNDLFQRDRLTPYQQQTLDLQRQQLGQRQTQGQVKSLEDLRQGLYGSPEFKNYSLSQPMLKTAEDLAGQNTAASGSALAVTTAKLRDPTSVAMPGEVEAVKSGSGNVFQKAAGWFNEKILGRSAFTPGVTQDLLTANRAQVRNYEEGAMKKIDSLAVEAARRGVNLQDILDPSDYQKYLTYKDQRQPGTASQYRWENGQLVPVN